MLGGRKYEPKFALIVEPWAATPSLVTGDLTYEALLVSCPMKIADYGPVHGRTNERTRFHNESIRH